MTADHLKVVLENHRDSDLFHNICQLLVRAAVPREIFSAIRIGRLIALQKANGGIRGIVAGDLLRRLVAQTMAQQLGPQLSVPLPPFQYALTTRAGTECIAHVVQALTDADATVLSTDGIGAFDLSMLEGLRRVEGGDSAFPFVSQFYGSPSSYLWEAMGKSTL